MDVKYHFPMHKEEEFIESLNVHSFCWFGKIFVNRAVENLNKSYEANVFNNAHIGVVNCYNIFNIRAGYSANTKVNDAVNDIGK